MENVASLGGHGLPLVYIKAIFHFQNFILKSLSSKRTVEMKIVRLSLYQGNTGEWYLQD